MGETPDINDLAAYNCSGSFSAAMQMLALADGASFHPFLILAICVIVIIAGIVVVRIHAFLALIIAAVLAGILAPVGSLPGEPAGSHWIQAVEITTAELGVVCGKVGLVIALASIIGVCIMESGAADKVVRRFLSALGERRAGLALVSGGFLLGLPIFFDTFFMLLVPLARAMRLRTGKDYLLYVLAICCAGSVTHSLVAPHPGPLAMVEILKVNLGWSVIVGVLAAIPAVMFGWQVAKWLNSRTDIPLRETPGLSLSDLREIANKPEAELPSFVASLLPVIVPILLISAASISGAVAGSNLGLVNTAIQFAGNRNVALFIGTVLAMNLLMRQRRLSFAALGSFLGPALETAGVIILITSAGGAFGLMLKHAGVGDAIREATSGRDVNMILFAWAVAVMMKFAQGSATVSMLTTAAMVMGVTQGAVLPYNPMYLFLAIGYGAIGVSWMNDSGFWVIGRLSGFTERETLRTWTLLAFSMSLFGLLETLLLAKLLPLK